MTTILKQILTAGTILASSGGALLASNDGSNYIRTTTFLTGSVTPTPGRVNNVYYDGMGREVLTVSGVSNEPQDMIAVRSDYDDRGNLWRKWLPVPGNESLLNKRSYESAAKGLYGSGEMPYTTYGYEETGRNRLVSEAGPGKHWHLKDVTKKFFRNADTLTHEKRNLICTMLRVDDADGRVMVGPFYKTGTLRITDTTDEDGISTLVFENRSGNVVLKRTISADGKMTADTRFVYDIRGDLRYVISPEGSKRIPATGKIPQNVLDDYAQCYTYDFRHRCVSEKIPGCGATEYVYDKFGNIIFSADAEQRARSEWTVTKYDRRLRPAVQGLAKLPAKTRQQLQTEYGDTLLVETFVPDANKVESSLQYTAVSGPSSFSPYMAWYYDDYRFIQAPNSSVKAQFETVSDGAYTALGLCTGTAMNGDGETFYRAVKYDARKNVIMTCLWDCYLQQIRYTETTDYDFVGQPVTRTEKKESMMEATVTASDRIVWQYTYDGAGHLTGLTLSINGDAPFTVTSSEYDAIGRMVSEWRGTDVAYAYDIRGRLSEISSDVYSETSGYGASPFPSLPVSYKNINYTAESWGGDRPWSVSMAYGYDGLGRMKSAVSQGSGATAGLSETLDVDLDANVVGVMRMYNGAMIQDAVMTMDGGKIAAVNDASSPYYADYVGRIPDGDYAIAYDLNGRLTADGSRQIKSITYHKFIDRPDRITMDNGDYTVSRYLPDGTLTKRSFTSKRIETVTKVNASGQTETREVTRTTTNVNSYIGSFWTMTGATGGRRVLTPAGYVDLTTGHRYWYLTNRQGSTMAVVDETGNIVQRNGYYPSGTPFILPSEIGSAEPPSLTEATDQLHIGNRWLGHSGMNMYDNSARLHDPILMRFGAPDPMFGKYPDTSPWTHCAANPINAIDPLGLDEYVINNNGEVIQQIPNNEKDIITIENTGNSKEFKKGTILGWTRVKNSKSIIQDMINLDRSQVVNRNSDPNNPTIDYLKVRGDDNAVEVFEFLSDELQNEKIEFSLLMTGMSGSKGLNFISTSHLESGDNSSTHLFNTMLSKGFNIRAWIHNHPGNTEPNYNDRALARQLWAHSLKMKKRIIWAVYQPTNHQYVPYNHHKNLNY